MKNAKSKVRISRARESDDDRTIYAVLREEFTAEDLQKFTKIEPLVPAEQVLADLENDQKKVTRKKKLRS